MIVATTNRPDLIDVALRSRLYTLQLPQPSREDLFLITRQIAVNLGLGDNSEEISHAVMKRLDKIENPTLRHVQHLLIEECVESGLWRV